MIKRFYVEIDVPRYFKRGINCADCPFSKGVYDYNVCLLTYDSNKVDRPLIDRFDIGSKEVCPLKMQVAKFGTYDNVEKAVQVIDEKTDALIDAMGVNNKEGDEDE